MAKPDNANHEGFTLSEWGSGGFPDHSIVSRYRAENLYTGDYSGLIPITYAGGSIVGE